MKFHPVTNYSTQLMQNALNSEAWTQTLVTHKCALMWMKASLPYIVLTSATVISHRAVNKSIDNPVLQLLVSTVYVAVGLAAFSAAVLSMINSQERIQAEADRMMAEWRLQNTPGR